MCEKYNFAYFTERSNPSGSALRFVKYKPILMILNK